jgi:hypothetical protein
MILVLVAAARPSDGETMPHPRATASSGAVDWLRIRGGRAGHSACTVADT